MDEIVFKLFLFRGLKDIPRSIEVIQILLDALTEIQLTWLKSGPIAPLYQSGVKYKKEPPGREWWQDIPFTYATKEGDCEDLGTIRAAELRMQGIAARAIPKWKIMPDKSVRVHILVWRPDIQKFEDPSLLLGMGREKEFAKEQASLTRK